MSVFANRLMALLAMASLERETTNLIREACPLGGKWFRHVLGRPRAFSSAVRPPVGAIDGARLADGMALLRGAMLRLGARSLTGGIPWSRTAILGAARDGDLIDHVLVPIARARNHAPVRAQKLELPATPANLEAALVEQAVMP